LLSRLEPSTGRVVQKIDPNSGPAGVALGPDAIWVTDTDANTVMRVDPTGLLTPIAVGHGPSGIAVSGGAVWVADTQDNAVVRVDPATRAVTTTISVGQAPTGVGVGEGAVWVANSGDGTVTRIDPTTLAATKTIQVGGSPQAISVADGRVWVTVDEQTLGSEASAGGVARVQSVFAPDFMDPALAFFPNSWELLYATCAKLVNYPDRPGAEGARLVPEVAQALPAISDRGKTYTFTIRKGFRFSPPFGQPVTAQTFKYTIERSLSPRLKGSAQGFLTDVVGAKAYAAGEAAHIAGITARGNTLTVRLLAPAPDLPTRLAMPFFCAVPIGTPVDPNGVRTIPMAGPYFVATYTPGQGVVLERNPNYRGARPHRLEKIRLTVNVPRKKTDAAIEAGTVDYGQDGPDPTNFGKLASRYGPASPAARRGKQRYFVNPQMHLGFLILNTHQPLFSDARVRRAVSYAVDRRLLSRIGDPYFGIQGQPTDQYLPPNMPGFKNAHIYPYEADVAAARRLLGPGFHRAAVLYTCNRSPCDRLAQVLKTDLAAIGIDLQVKTFPFTAMVARIGRPGEPYDLAFGSWLEDYPDPADFLNYLLISGGAGAIPPFDDPNYVRKANAAAKLSGPRRYLAYGVLDADVAKDDAPWVAILNGQAHDFFSARMGCQVFNPVYGTDLAHLCIRP
jgi:peptide/nickel transport system substrate-binding protein